MLAGSAYTARYLAKNSRSSCNCAGVQGTCQSKLNRRKSDAPSFLKAKRTGRIVPVRFSVEEVQRITAAANASNQKLSEWIRSTLNAATA
jgi:hypothetical protein